MVELSNQVSSLKDELVTLRQSMAHTRADKKNVIMFTALDMERNKQTLKLAVETNKYVIISRISRVLPYNLTRSALFDIIIIQ